jgi:hypothetical protein
MLSVMGETWSLSDQMSTDLLKRSTAVSIEKMKIVGLVTSSFVNLLG